jgi:signal transduction histidine kinase
MSQLTVVSTHAMPSDRSGAQAAHDLRNLLSIVGLHVETLQRLSGPGGTKAADGIQALLARGAALCNDWVEGAARDGRIRRKGVDLMQVSRQVADLLAPSAPKDFSIELEPSSPVTVLADPDEVFRILFNLMSNATAVARCNPGLLTTVTLAGAADAETVTLTVADDGPGLPANVRSCLFGARPPRSAAPRHGYGLAIARELAERNGGTLTLVPRARGAAFALRLPAFLSLLSPGGSRHLGRRAMAL